MRESAVRNSPLPPSVEKAYHQKCIDLKKRLREIEDNNDAARVRKLRLDRAILKMRIERAILLEQLTRIQQDSGDESDKSTSPPPTVSPTPAPRVGNQTRAPRMTFSTQPRDRPPRMKRSYNRRSSAGAEQLGSRPSPPPSVRQTSHFPGQFHPALLPRQQHILTFADPAASPPTSIRQGPHPAQDINLEELPLIHSLPAETSVVLVNGQPKEGPWTIKDLDPRHIVSPHFEQMTLLEQEDALYLDQYLPHDHEGKCVLVQFDLTRGKYRHIFPKDPDWKNPIDRHGYRDDGAKFAKRAEEYRERRESDIAAAASRRQGWDAGGMSGTSMSPAAQTNGAGGGSGAGVGFTAANR